MGYTRSDLLEARNRTESCHLNNEVQLLLKQYNIQKVRVKRTQRGNRAGRNLQRRISVIPITNRKEKQIREINRENLLYIKPDLPTTSKQSRTFSACLVNAQSAKQKTDVIVDYILDKDLDLLVITELWLYSHDTVELGELQPTGYKLKCFHREDRQGGGIAIIHKDGMKVKVITQPAQQKSFESLEVQVTSGNGNLRLLAVYRPQKIPGMCAPVRTFLNEFSTRLESLITQPSELLVVGDFNFHVDETNDLEARRYINMLNSFDLIQHVDEPTHINGHILDHVITRNESKSIIKNVYVDTQISDHFSVIFNLTLEKPVPVRKTVKFRKLKSIDEHKFRKELQDNISEIENKNEAESLVTSYNSVLMKTLDSCAPIQEKTVTIRHHSPWFNDKIREAKKNRRKAEKKWRKTRADEDRLAFVKERQEVVLMLRQAKQEFYSDIIQQSKHNQKDLFRIIDTLLQRNKDMPLPPHDNPCTLANEFTDFFVGKIDKIRDNIKSLQPDSHCTSEEEKCFETELDIFQPATEDEIRTMIMRSSAKTCVLDPIPSWLLKLYIEEVLPLITMIVNTCLSSSTMPQSLKTAIVTPILKKIILELITKNYRPVSNLPFLSKIVEKVVASRLLVHQKRNKSLENLQSAYKEGHSTETALLCVQSDILQAMDKQNIIILVLLDLSAAFDTIDYSLLLQRLSDRIGIKGQALDWFRSYLSERLQSVTLQGKSSRSVPLSHGVPQGSVLGPILFTIYVTPLGDIMRKHKINFHTYADDTQIYLSFRPTSSVADNLKRIQECIADIRSWMIKNMLKLNEDKTEMLVIGTKQQLKKITVPELVSNGCVVQPKDSVRNLGVLLDKHMSMEPQVSAICKSTFHHLRNIRKIRKFLDRSTAETAIHALVSSRLDTCNSLLYGIPKYQLQRLQRVQNTAARVITMTKKYDHITPILRELHWLPITERIEFKCLCLTYKAIHGTAPGYICDMIHQYQPTRSVRSASNLLLEVPSTRLVTCGDRSFHKVGPTLWNSLPLKVRSAKSLNTFKSALKTYLFKRYFTD